MHATTGCCQATALIDPMISAIDISPIEDRHYITSTLSTLKALFRTPHAVSGWLSARSTKPSGATSG